MAPSTIAAYATVFTQASSQKKSVYASSGKKSKIGNTIEDFNGKSTHRINLWKRHCNYALPVPNLHLKQHRGKQVTVTQHHACALAILK